MIIYCAQVANLLELQQNLNFMKDAVNLFEVPIKRMKQYIKETKYLIQQTEEGLKTVQEELLTLVKSDFSKVLIAINPQIQQNVIDQKIDKTMFYILEREQRDKYLRKFMEMKNKLNDRELDIWQAISDINLINIYQGINWLNDKERILHYQENQKRLIETREKLNNILVKIEKWKTDSDKLKDKDIDYENEDDFAALMYLASDNLTQEVVFDNPSQKQRIIIVHINHYNTLKQGYEKAIQEIIAEDNLKIQKEKDLEYFKYVKLPELQAELQEVQNMNLINIPLCDKFRDLINEVIIKDTSHQKLTNELVRLKTAHKDLLEKCNNDPIYIIYKEDIKDYEKILEKIKAQQTLNNTIKVLGVIFISISCSLIGFMGKIQNIPGDKEEELKSQTI